MKDKKWLLQQLDEAAGMDARDHEWNAGFDAGINEAESLAMQLDEPEKPVIPQFVAEHIEKARKYDYNVYGAMRAVHDPHRFEDITATEEMKQWLVATHHDVFARAWLDGYTVEQEKRYLIKMPLTGCVLALWEQENEWEFMRPDEIAGNSEWKSQFTEAEIKAIDPKYIAFAEEVRE